jgi:hypothetical protein
MKSFFRCRNFSSVLVGAALAAMGVYGTARTWAEGYLAKVGPTPLRFQALRVEGAIPLPPLPVEPEIRADNAESAQSAGNEAVGSSSTKIPAELLAPYAMWWSRFAGTNNAESIPSGNPGFLSNSIVGVPPASDLLPVSPEMLVEYFKPVQGPTNSASATVMVPLDFTPAAPPTRGSSAIYRSP